MLPQTISDCKITETAGQPSNTDLIVKFARHIYFMEHPQQPTKMPATNEVSQACE